LLLLLQGCNGVPQGGRHPPRVDRNLGMMDWFKIQFVII
jgi:hypothetical protein